MHTPIEPHIYTTWANMWRRCYFTKDPEYKNYGARGITVCERWQSVFTFSLDVGQRPEGCSLDRRDNDGPYSPENCRWATIREQLRNRRITRRLTMNGVTMTIDEWAEQLKMSRITIAVRMRRGWTDLEALSTPVDREGHRVHQRQSIAICRKAGISRGAFYARLKRGWSEEEALNTPKHQGQRRVEPNQG